jgi:hypothetical protein
MLQPRRTFWPEAVYPLDPVADFTWRPGLDALAPLRRLRLDLRRLRKAITAQLGRFLEPPRPVSGYVPPAADPVPACPGPVTLDAAVALIAAALARDHDAPPGAGERCVCLGRGP